MTKISASSYLFLFIPVPRVSEALLNEVIRSVEPPLGYLILHAVGVCIMPCLLPETLPHHFAISANANLQSIKLGTIPGSKRRPPFLSGTFWDTKDMAENVRDDTKTYANCTSFVVKSLKADYSLQTPRTLIETLRSTSPSTLETGALNIDTFPIDYTENEVKGTLANAV